MNQQIEKKSDFQRCILVVDDEKEILNMLDKLLTQRDYQVLTAESGEDAINILKEHQDEIDLVVTDYRLPKMTGIEVLIHIRNNYSLLPVIIITAYGQKELVIEALQNRCDGFIEKPFDIKNFFNEVERVLQESQEIENKYASKASTSNGMIQGITLATFLQAVHTEEKNWTLYISAGSKTGYLYFKEGEMINAETKDLKGEDAAIEIVGWDNATIQIQNNCTKEQEIDSSLKYILFESFRRKDEISSEIQTEETLLERAIWLAQGRHFKEAKDILKKMLEENPRNHKAWLWYSRVMKKVKNIEAALINAAKINPNNPEVMEEIEKLNLVKSTLTLEKSPRCPFCWSPVDEKAVLCHYCRGHLSIHKDFFDSKRDSRKDILENAIDRYHNILSKEKNINAHYYCGMAFLNIENWEEALNHFHLTVNLAPKNTFLLGQLNILIDYIESGSNIADEIDYEGKELDQEVEDIPVKKKGIKVLVVEDSPTTRKVVSITLSRNGYSVVEAVDGLEALSKVNEERPNLVLLDIILPKMDGYKVLSIIKSNQKFRNIPVIMLTSKNAYENRIKGELVGSTAYLTKPFDPDQLVETIENTLLKTATT